MELKMKVYVHVCSASSFPIHSWESNQAYFLCKLQYQLASPACSDINVVCSESDVLIFPVPFFLCLLGILLF